MNTDITKPPPAHQTEEFAMDRTVTIHDLAERLGTDQETAASFADHGGPYTEDEANEIVLIWAACDADGVHHEPRPAVEGLNCLGHDGPHKLGLNLRLGTDGPAAGHVALNALPHAFVPSVDDTQADERAHEATVELARAVLTRAAGSDPDVTDEEAAALIAAVESARQYMIDNHYANQEDGEQEAADAYVARVLEPGNLVNICWVGRPPVRS